MDRYLKEEYYERRETIMFKVALSITTFIWGIIILISTTFRSWELMMGGAIGMIIGSILIFIWQVYNARREFG